MSGLRKRAMSRSLLPSVANFGDLGRCHDYFIIMIAFETEPTVTVSIRLPSRVILLYTSRMSRRLAFAISYAYQSY